MSLLLYHDLITSPPLYTQTLVAPKDELYPIFLFTFDQFNKEFRIEPAMHSNSLQLHKLERLNLSMQFPQKILKQIPTKT